MSRKPHMRAAVLEALFIYFGEGPSTLPEDDKTPTNAPSSGRPSVRSRRLAAREIAERQKAFAAYIAAQGWKPKSVATCSEKSNIERILSKMGELRTAMDELRKDVASLGPDQARDEGSD
jgi:hypothetical protein